MIAITYIFQKNTFLSLLISLVITGILHSCTTKTPDSEVTTTDVESENRVILDSLQLKMAALTFTKIQMLDMASVLHVNGEIDVPPQNMVSVSMPLGGYLKSTKLLPGMHVAKGEIIATMEDLQYIQLQQDFLSTKARLQFSEKEYLRQKELNSIKASSDKVFEQSEMEYNALKINLSALAEKLRLIHIDPDKLNENSLSKSANIYSPIDGFVSKVNVNIGKYVNPSDILFELVNPSDIHLNLKIFEKDLEKLFIGQKLVAYTNNKPNEKHPCEIILISKDISAERTAEVHCHFEDYDKNLLPGMYMNAEIKVTTKSAEVVPESAVVSFEGKDYIFIKESTHSFLMTEVKVALVNNGNAEIKPAVALDRTNVVIVEKGAYSLLMQLKNKSEE